MNGENNKERGRINKLQEDSLEEWRTSKYFCTGLEGILEEKDLHNVNYEALVLQIEYSM